MTATRRRSTLAIALTVLLTTVFFSTFFELRSVAAETDNPFTTELAALNLLPAPPGIDAPSVPLSKVDGSTAQLADFRGKVVLLNFWATW